MIGFSLFIFLISIQNFGHGQHLCTVFQPFKVTPENAKFEIGGPFPLHTEDCLHVREDIVQELIGVQWALSHWNQNPKNTNSRIALSAFDTCSRSQESMSQTMTFLHESGHFLPKECKPLEGYSGKIPLGLLMPMTHDGRLQGLKDALIGVQSPIISYSGPASQALIDAEPDAIFSTAPTLDHFMEASIALLKSLNSDLITLIYSDQQLPKLSLEKQLNSLTKSKITVSKTLKITDSQSSITTNPTEEIILIIASKDEIINYFINYNGKNSKKLFIILPALGEFWTKDEIDDFLLLKSDPDPDYRLIVIQQGEIFSEIDFQDYFLDILKNNYENYVLLAKYMQQEYNCTLIGTKGVVDCEDIEFDEMIDGFRYNRRIESAVLATYAYGSLARYLASDKQETCLFKSGAECIKKIKDYLKYQMTYRFDDADPSSYRGFVLRFGSDNTLISLPIQGLYATRNSSGHPDDSIRIESIFNFTTGSPMESNKIHVTGIRWSDNRSINRIRCESWRPECQHCTDDQKFSSAADRLWIQKRRSDFYLMGLFDLRRSEDGSIDNPKSILGPASFVYILENIRKKYPENNLLPNFEIGGLIFDSHFDQIASVEAIAASASDDRCIFVNEGDTVTKIPSKNILGFISGQRGTIYDLIHQIFQQIQKPLIGSIRDTKSSQNNQLSITPDIDLQSRALMSLLLRHNWDYVSVLVSEHDEESVKAYESFRRLAESDGRICVADIVYVRAGARIESILNTNTPLTKIFIAFTTAQDTILLLKTRQSYGRNSDDATGMRPIYIFMGDAHDWEIDGKQESGVRSWKTLALGSLSIQPRKSVDIQFRTFLSNLNPKKINDRWFLSFWEDYFHCSIGQSENSGRKRCTGDEKFPIELLNGRMTRESYFMTAIENFIIALDKVYKKLCPETNGICETFLNSDFNRNISDVLLGIEKSDDYVIYNYRSDLDNVNGGAYVEIGTWSTSTNIKLNGTWIWYNSDRKPNTSIPESSCRPPSCHCRTTDSIPNKKRPMSAEKMISGSGDNRIKSSSSEADSDDDQSIIGRLKNYLPSTGERWKTQTWTWIFLIINTILLSAACLVLTIVSVKLCCGIVKGNQSLGICLLFGVILLYATAYCFIFDESEIICRFRYICHSFAYSVSFGVMIAKAVQLRNSETLGINGFISYWNYWILLFFIIAVQMALNIQWAIVRNPISVSVIDDEIPSASVHCNWTNEEFLASQVYIILLLCMATFLALLNRNVKRNYKETHWLMYTSFLCAAIWVAWMVGYPLTPELFKDTVVVMELMTCATVILCFMFGPKLYILLRYESIFKGRNPAQHVFKIPPQGPILGTDITKRHSLAMPSTPNPNDVGIHHFDDGDPDDQLDDDGRRSVLSIKSGMTISQTISSASSITGSEDSTTPVLQSAIRKKSRSKNRHQVLEQKISDQSSASGKNRPPSTILEESASMH